MRHLTGTSLRSIARRLSRFHLHLYFHFPGVEVKTHARQLAIVSKEKSKITLFHFQSTSVADPKCPLTFAAMPAAFERTSRVLASDGLLVHIENIRAFKAQTPNKNGLSYNEPIS